MSCADCGEQSGGTEWRNAYGVYFIFKSMEVGPTFRIIVPKYPTNDPNQRSRFTHYYFCIRDELLGPIVMSVGSFFPFKTSTATASSSASTRQTSASAKNDNAFLVVDDVAALQAAANMPSPEIIRKRLDYWTFILGPKFSAKERRQVKLSRT